MRRDATAPAKEPQAMFKQSWHKVVGRTYLLPRRNAFDAAAAAITLAILLWILAQIAIL